ncbi:MAG: sulfatase-like hydrolase/transferase [Brumimicrobium sp.]|nr:sulfatase-like hydrolase/transferase [Brumimicrobium sp.]
MHWKLLILFLFLVEMSSAQKYYPPVPFDSALYEGKQYYLTVENKTNTAQKNVILIVADDMGKFDLSIYGNPYIQTPNIDAIAQSGILFNAGYATAAVCSPSRAGFITGRYQQRFGFHVQPHQRYPKNKFELWAFRNLINTNSLHPEGWAKYPNKENKSKMGLPQSEITIAEMLKMNGYRTALCGKWHLGYNAPLLPEYFGFDYRYGFNEAYSLFADPKDPTIVNARIKEFTDKVIWKGGRKGACAIFENGVEVEEKEYLTYAFFRKAKEFIGEKNEQPFFVFLPVNAPHTPYQAPKDIYDKLDHISEHNKRVYYAMIVALDNAIGDLVDYLKRTNQYENTLIIFTSDNGAALYSGTVNNEPLNAGKFTLFEGGVNIPFMMSCPSAIKEHLEISQPVSLLDIFPTIADFTHSKMPTDREYDGVSLSNCFLGDSIELERQREAIYWYSDYNSAIRVGNYKLIINDLDNTVDLYNLKTDPYEKNNLSNNQEEIEKLKAQLTTWKNLMPRMYWPRIMNYEVEINGKIYRWAV